MCLWCLTAQMLLGLQDPAPSLVSHGCAVSFGRLLQVVIVWQNLHEEVELQSLRLQDTHVFKKTSPVRQMCTHANKSFVTHRQRQALAGRLTCGFSLCTRLMQFEPYTTVFSGTTSHVLTWQHAPMMQPLVRITFLPRSAGIQHYKIHVFSQKNTLQENGNEGCRAL